MVEFRGVSKRFDSTEALNELTLEIRPGEFLTLLGPSGCGKTTTLRLLAGFEEPTSGEIWLAGRPVQGLPAYKRPVNTVFQHYALFPHMTVFDNVAFGLRMKKVPPAEIRRRVAEALELVRLGDLGNRRPHELSGGQQQRVAPGARPGHGAEGAAAGRAAGGASTSSSGARCRSNSGSSSASLGATFLYVTHDQEEALAMSDRIAVMRNGRVEQVGTPEEVYLRPATRFVAQFLGEANLLEGEGTATRAPALGRLPPAGEPPPAARQDDGGPAPRAGAGALARLDGAACGPRRTGCTASWPSGSSWAPAPA